MKNFITITIMLASLCITGCTGKFYTITDTKEACKQFDSSGECIKYNGVFIRPLVPVPQRIVRDRILDSKGAVTHHANGSGDKKCLPLTLEITKLMADISQQQIVQYSPGLFESSSFSLTLNSNGTIKSVGTTSTHGGKALVESLVALNNTFDPNDTGSESNDTGDALNNAPHCSHGELPATVR